MGPVFPGGPSKPASPCRAARRPGWDTNARGARYPCRGLLLGNSEEPRTEPRSPPDIQGLPPSLHVPYSGQASILLRSSVLWAPNQHGRRVLSRRGAGHLPLLSRSMPDTPGSGPPSTSPGQRPRGLWVLGSLLTAQHGPPTLPEPSTGPVSTSNVRQGGLARSTQARGHPARASPL